MPKRLSGWGHRPGDGAVDPVSNVKSRAFTLRAARLLREPYSERDEKRF